MTFEGHFSTVVTLCAQLTRDLLAIAKFFVRLVLKSIWSACMCHSVLFEGDCFM